MDVLHRTTPMDPVRLISQGKIFSEVPILPGKTCVDAGSAAYYDGNLLHVWYGAVTYSLPWAVHNAVNHDDLFYTRSADLINWSTPVLVIHGAIQVNCPTQLIQNNFIYLFIQGAFPDHDTQNQILLYRLALGSDYSNPLNYVFIGNAIDTGPPGSFDFARAACPSVIKIGKRIHLFYEAIDHVIWYGEAGCTLAKAYSDDIEATPYIKQGPIRDETDSVFTNPGGYIMAPHPPMSSTVLPYCYSANGNDTWRTSLLYNTSLENITGYRRITTTNNLANIEDGIIVGTNPPCNLASICPSIANSFPELQPTYNPFCDWIYLTPIGIIRGYYYYLMQAYDAGNTWPWIEFPHLYLLRTPLHIVYPRHRSDRHTLKLSRKPYSLTI